MIRIRLCPTAEITTKEVVKVERKRRIITGGGRNLHMETTTRVKAVSMARVAMMKSLVLMNTRVDIRVNTKVNTKVNTRVNIMEDTKVITMEDITEDTKVMVDMVNPVMKLLRHPSRYPVPGVLQLLQLATQLLYQLDHLVTRLSHVTRLLHPVLPLYLRAPQLRQ